MMNRNLLAAMFALWALPALVMGQVATNQPDPATAPTAVPATAVTPATTIAAPRASNKWRIKFDESSKSDGVITFRIWPTPTTTADVPVSVSRHQAENSIARATRDALRTALGKGYKIETDDGEDVLVKAGGRTPDFGLALVASTADDVDIRIRRE